MPLFPPCFPVWTSPGSGSSRRKQKASQYMMREKKKQASYRKSKTRYGRREKKKKSDAIHDCNVDSSRIDDEKEFKVVGLCKCFSLCDVFGSKRRYRQQLSSYPDVGYESGMSTSSPTINNLSFDNKTQNLTPLQMSCANDEMSCGSTDSKSSVTRSNASDTSLLDIPKIQDTKTAQIADFLNFDNSKVQYYKSTSGDSSSDAYLIPGDDIFSEQKAAKSGYDGTYYGSCDSSYKSDPIPLMKKKQNITPPGKAPNSGTDISDNGLSGENKTSINEGKNIIDPYDVQRIERRCSDCFSLPDDAETALIEHQLDEMSNQSSCLSFESDDFLEDDHDEGNYSAHGEGGIDLMPISEETGEDSE